ncbi:MAG: hypothetical protein E7099_05035 [Mediterranea massiliensis]|nr:hypothetical protein [Mediterranea massiliensis]
MKKVALLLVSMFVLSLTVKADDDKPIQVSEMPVVAQKIIKNYFPGRTVAMAKVEMDFMNKSYEVIFTNGDKVEFDKKGNWTNVDCEYSQVPAEIIPTAIRNYLSKHYPEAKVLQIDIDDRKKYDVELNNGFELKFDKRFRLIDVDR